MKMKKLLLLLPLTFLSVPVQAQQVNNYGVCTQYREVYQPGYYDSNGNYVQGGVNTQSYNVPCNSIGSNYVSPGPQPYYNNQPYYRPRNCAAAPLGAILGGLGAYAATSRVSNRWWSVPLGVVTGGIVGNAACNTY